jgi:trimethylamine--corrinoid protein Co-methyltransferase
MFDAKRPKLELLDKGFVEKIVDEALTLLDRHGVMVENAEAARLLGEAGARVDAGTQRIRLGRKLVEDCLASTPATTVLYDRKGEKAFAVGGDEVHFDPGSAAVTMLDHATQEQRKASTRDVVDLSKLVETLEPLHFQRTALIAADVTASVSDACRL